ncbi:MAG: tetratricopeptide repeat protein [Alphaproteobacteria bacterium]|nr:tetratricopeptide repeat protein [Alphaproteobacteria bacterium]MDP7223409.1 tetratricopeptide repeat protein [Alphaproteobacteria bacterium]
MKTRIITNFFLLGMLAGVGGWYFYGDSSEKFSWSLPSAETLTQDFLSEPLIRLQRPIYNWKPEPARETVAGNFLSGYYAQNHGDWQSASEHFTTLSELDPANKEILKRAMILSLGVGDLDTASKSAKKLLDHDTADSIAMLVIAVRAIDTRNLENALQYLDDMPQGDITTFVKPLLRAWVQVGLDQEITETLDESTIHMYHRGLISVYLGNIDDAVEAAETILEQPALSLFEIERAADLYLLAGKKDKAKEWYEQIQSRGDSEAISDKIAALETDNKEMLNAMTGVSEITDVRQGVALSLYDMALILSREQSYTVTRLFTSMALALNDDITEAKLLLANALVKSGRYDEAVGYLSAIDESHPTYLPTMRYVAELLTEAERFDDARALLNDLFLNHNDVKSLIQIGDLYRRQENYAQALDAYNKAVSHMGDTIPDEFWYVLYGRGMAYEREGDWKKAETDLKAALVYRPNHPYLLNYLGYGWAEQGVELEKASELIEKAVQLKPTDGYIRDSLGWVLYMMGRYEESVVHLEKAIELLPYDPTINDHLGDAYWQVGRYIEAKYQWERAKNHKDEMADIERIEHKIKYGLTAQDMPHAVATDHNALEESGAR